MPATESQTRRHAAALARQQDDEAAAKAAHAKALNDAIRRFEALRADQVVAPPLIGKPKRAIR